MCLDLRSINGWVLNVLCSSYTGLIRPNTVYCVGLTPGLIRLTRSGADAAQHQNALLLPKDLVNVNFLVLPPEPTITVY